MPRPKSPPEHVRECRGCSRVYPLAEAYWPRHETCRNGFDTYCKPCRQARKKAWKLEHRAKLRLIHTPVDNPQRAHRGHAERVGKHCGQCYGQAHRRPRFVVCKCGLRFEPLPPIELVTRTYYDGTLYS